MTAITLSYPSARIASSVSLTTPPSGSEVRGSSPRWSRSYTPSAVMSTPSEYSPSSQRIFSGTT